MPICPLCNAAIRLAPTGDLFECKHCGAVGMHFRHLLDLCRYDEIEKIPRQALQQHAEGKGRCLGCSTSLTAITFSFGVDELSLYYCQRCRQVYFGRQVYRALLKGPQSSQQTSLGSPNQVSSNRSQRSKPKDYSGWQYALALLGFPVVADRSSNAPFPLVTWVLVAAVSWVSLLSLLAAKEVFENFALIPSDPFRKGGLTLLTVFFLHGGIEHLLGNMIFLITFGSACEDRLGAWRYLLLIALSTIAANFAQIAIDPQSTIPVVGASGGVAGVMAFYCMTFPKSEFALFMWWLPGKFHNKMFRFTAIYGLGFYIVGQILGILSVRSFIAYGAHLGGLLFGLFAWFVVEMLFGGRQPKAN